MTEDVRFWVSMAIVVIGWAISWGDLRRQVKANRDRSDEREQENMLRHKENVEWLREIGSDVRRINGQVAAHSEAIDQLEGRMDRIQRGRH